MILSHSPKRILVIGDSLCLPRNRPESVALLNTWPSILRHNTEYEVIQLAIGGGTISTLLEQAHYYESCNPDIVIVQSGIVDCAPRALSFIEKELINSNKILSYLADRFLPINFMRRHRNVTYTSTKKYRKKLKEIVKLFSNSKILFIGILPARSEYEIYLPGINENIETYNKIIQEEIFHNCLFLCTKNIPDNGIMSDHHHLNFVGHKWISEQILRNL